MNDGLHHVAARFHHVFEVGAASVRVGTARGQFLEVVPGRIGRTVRSDNNRADAFVVANGIECLVECRNHRFRKRVAGRRRIERQHGNAADGLAQKWRRRL